ADARSIGAIGTDKRCQHDETRVRKEPRNLPHAANVFAPVVPRKAQVGTEAVAHIVAIEHIGRLPRRDEPPLNFEGDRALAAGRKARKPDGTTRLSQHGPPVRARDMAGMPDNVTMWNARHA